MSSRLFALARSAVMAAIFVSIWTWFFPRWFARSGGVALEPRPNALNVALMIAGGTLMLVCVFQFGWTGRGTPAPFDPPRRLVIRGPYLSLPQRPPLDSPNHSMVRSAAPGLICVAACNQDKKS